MSGTAFTELSHNAIFIGGPVTGETYLATTNGVADITRHGKRVRFYSTVDHINAPEREMAARRLNFAKASARSKVRKLCWAIAPTAEIHQVDR
ncbi:ATP-binding protein [Paucibacter sp. KCTC 42545]|uniref:ATP-binding protein n=1 Tax=Paucibacter sp. KCTC 42545 TaxID=1768242 RepID=UPI0009E98571|nr:ATP-binding protein [Paucibacter sp. KCTC 42545]